MIKTEINISLTLINGELTIDIKGVSSPSTAFNDLAELFAQRLEQAMNEAIAQFKEKEANHVVH